MKMLAMTGVTGKSGGELARQIAENMRLTGERFPDGVRVLVRESSNTDRLDRLLPSADKRVVELTDVEGLKAALAGVDTLVHVAGVHWSREVVTAAAYDKVRRLILVHTTGIYSKYKAAGEEYRRIDADVYKLCEDNGILLTILRPTMIYGNTRDKNVISFIKMVDRLPLMPVVNGARYDLQPVHYTDVGKACYQVLTHESATVGREFILSGASPIQLREMLEVIGARLGKTVRFISCPFPIAYAGAWVIYLLSLTRCDYREKVQRLCEPRCFPHAAAAAAFGYEPLSFEQGVTEEIEDYLKER